MRRFQWYSVPIVLLLVGLFWIVLFLHPARRADPWYGVIEIGLVVATFLMASFMIWETELWTVRSLGMLLYITGDTALYFVFTSQNYRIFHFTRGEREGITDLAASFFVVGLPLLAYGLYKTSVYDWSQRDRSWRGILFPPNWPLRLGLLILVAALVVFFIHLEADLTVLVIAIGIFILGIIIFATNFRRKSGDRETA